MDKGQDIVLKLDKCSSIDLDWDKMPASLEKVSFFKEDNELFISVSNEIEIY